MEAVGKAFTTIGQSYFYMFVFGGAAGAGFELFKIKFTMKGVNYYSVFKKNQLKRDLDNFENELRSTEVFLREQFDQKKSEAPA